MKPLYLKIIEKKQVSFIKVVRNRSHATVVFLIRSSDNSWRPDAKMFNPDKKEDKQKYMSFIESCLESSRDEFDEASKEVLKQADALPKKTKGNS